jgi:hypothetical protein
MYNKYPKILGLILDEQLNFNNHIEYIIKRAKRSLGIIREIKIVLDYFINSKDQELHNID